MNLKRAAWNAVLLYIATFVVGIFVAVILGTDLTGEQPITIAHWVLTIILSVVLACLFSLWYFKGKGIKAGPEEGLKLGLTYFAFGILFDLLFLIPYLLSGVGDAEALVQYYKDVWFWVSVVLIVLTPVVVGKVKKK